MPKFKNLNQRQEVFCQHVAAGLSGVEAFKRVTPGSPRDCDVKAAQMRRKPGVEERIRELMRENDKRARLSREEALRFLSDAIRTPADVVPERSWVIQSIKRSEDGTTVEIKLPDKVQCVAQMARMCNWNSAERIELSMDSLTSYLVELRQQPFIGGRVLELERPALPVESEANGEEEPPRSQ